MFEAGQIVVYTKDTNQNASILATVGSKARVRGYVKYEHGETYLDVEWIKPSEKFKQMNGGYYENEFVPHIEKDDFEETGVE